jgi:hypothetical protein
MSFGSWAFLWMGRLRQIRGGKFPNLPLLLSFTGKILARAILAGKTSKQRQVRKLAATNLPQAATP